MLFLTLFIVVVIAVVGFAVWPALADTSGEPPGTRASAAAADLAGRGEAKPESLEGVLVVQLMAGEITRSQYLHSIEGLAARDDDRHPLAVPPEIGPADA